MLSVLRKFALIVLFILIWVGIDHLANRISVAGFVTPWYPQIAMSVALLLAAGLSWVWLVFSAKIISSIVVWPGDITERILPNLVFAAGVYLICFIITRLRNSSELTRAKVLKALGLQALIILAVATFRSFYYADAVTQTMSLVSGIFHNWLADLTSLMCLLPGLTLLFDPLRREYRTVGLQYLKKFWYLPGLIVLLEAFVLLTPEHLQERLWYVSFLPCIAFAVVSGLEGMILLSFFTNVFLGGIAITTFSRQGAVEMQVFFISMNLLLYFLGSITSDRRKRIVNILNTNRQYIYSQFNKVNALILMQSEISQHLKAILKELENHSSTESVSEVAKDFLQKLDLFFANLELKNKTQPTLKYVETVYLKQRIRENLVSVLPSNFIFPEIEISKNVPVQMEMDADFFDLVTKQMTNLVYQINPQAKTPACLFIDWKHDVLHIQAKIYGSMKSVQAQQISFMSAYWSFQNTLPTGGFALTSYILHALAARISGEFWLQPLWFSHEDVLVAEFLIPLGQKKKLHKDYRL